jgi:hypothetical protein
VPVPRPWVGVSPIGRKGVGTLPPEKEGRPVRPPQHNSGTHRAASSRRLRRRCGGSLRSHGLGVLPRTSCIHAARTGSASMPRTTTTTTTTTTAPGGGRLRLSPQPRRSTGSGAAKAAPPPPALRTKRPAGRSDASTFREALRVELSLMSPTNRPPRAFPVAKTSHSRDYECRCCFRVSFVMSFSKG